MNEFEVIRYSFNLGNVKIVEFLIQSGIDINHRDNSGSTALMIAANSGSTFLRLFKFRCKTFSNARSVCNAGAFNSYGIANSTERATELRMRELWHCGWTTHRSHDTMCSVIYKHSKAFTNAIRICCVCSAYMYYNRNVVWMNAYKIHVYWLKWVP